VKKIPTSLKKKLRDIELLILDVDGVLTDNNLFIGTDGLEFKRFDVPDGMGIAFAMRAGLKIAFVSGRPSPATTSRARELGVKDLFQDPGGKVAVYEKLKKKYKLRDNQMAFMGDEVVDLKAMQRAGLSIAVPNSYKPVEKVADFVTEKRGGYGAVREVIEMILLAKGIKLLDLVR
jgi:3-deoxy-D-manno-octulosonate 8-phosphate phosphatase (KDO 8-P phosphatase)